MARSVKSKKNRVANYYRCPEPYLMIPHSLILSETFRKLTPYSKTIYLVLLTKWNRDHTKKNEIIIPLDTLQLETDLCRGTLCKGLKELEMTEFIYIEHGGYHLVNKYSFNLSWLVKP